MPIQVNVEGVTESISLNECIQLLIDSKFDPSIEDSFLEVAPILKKLSNNKSFLSELIIDELKSKCTPQSNSYTSQVIMLMPPEEKLSFFLRANIWLPKDNSMLIASGEKSFFYHVPHDHNFNFMTAGYWGPGYLSEYYEYDYSRVIGYPGENVSLKFIERSNLKEGEVILYRAHKDVHNQLPAESLSVSLNIMESSWYTHLKPQYIFENNFNQIREATVSKNSAMEPLFSLAAEIGEANGLDFIIQTILKSPIEENKYRAFKALVNSHNSTEEKVRLINKYGVSSKSKYLSNIGKNMLNNMDIPSL